MTGRERIYASCCAICEREWKDGKVGIFCPTCGHVVLHGTLDSWRAPNGRNYRKAVA